MDYPKYPDNKHEHVHILIILYYSRCDAIEEANAGRDFGDTGRWGCTVILTILIILILAETDGDGDTAETRVIPRTRADAKLEKVLYKRERCLSRIRCDAKRK